MPRTKVSKQAAAMKRNRVSAITEARLAALQDLDNFYAHAVMEQESSLEKNVGMIKDKLLNYLALLPSHIGEMMLGDLEKLGIEPLGTDLSNISLASAVTNNTMAANCSSVLSRNMKSYRSASDDGYVTEENAHSKVTGPLSSAKARPRRSRSAHTSSSVQSNLRSKPLIKSGSMSHSSRSHYRTPAQNRLQTQSADRMLKPITPKCQANTPVAMLRYPKHGETVVSLSGSPVIVQGVVHESANINIPINDGIFSIQPSVITNADADLVSRINPDTLLQLKQLQANLNLIMSQARL